MKRSAHFVIMLQLYDAMNVTKLHIFVLIVTGKYIQYSYPLHDRESWTGEYFKFIASTLSPDSFTGNLVDVERKITPNMLPAVCVHCGSKKIKSTHCANKRIVVTMRGRHELDDDKIICDQCNTELFPDGYWPGTVERSITQAYRCLGLYIR